MNSPYRSSKNQAGTKTRTEFMAAAAAAARCTIGLGIVQPEPLIG